MFVIVPKYPRSKTTHEAPTVRWENALRQAFVLSEGLRAEILIYSPLWEADTGTVQYTI